jgi:glycogen synthase
MDNLVVIPSSNSEERILKQIERFRDELYNHDDNVEYAAVLMDHIYEYLNTFEDPDVVVATTKLRESVLFLNHFVYSD